MIENRQSNYTDEMDHLEKIKVKLAAALHNYEETVERYDREYRDSKRYLAEYRNEIDPREIFQNEMAMKQIERAGIMTVHIRDRIAKLIDSPYFARIDFREEDEKDAAVFYIGRFSFSDKEKAEILIFDWRAPVSSIFYDYEPGPAEYDAPIGRVQGELTRKRQFKISRGQLEYALESAVSIRDDVLQKELSHTSDEKMKSIIATIQKEQNRIIRSDHAETLIIQGVAGSGKTSVALHRIAFLLYRYKETLSARNVVILSPNKVFADYISNVLPELGEEPIFELSFTDLAEIQLDGIIRFQPAEDPQGTGDPSWAERVRLKSGINFVKRVDEYLEHAADAYFEPADCTFGRFKISGEWIRERYDAYRNYPVMRRLREVAEDIYNRFATENIRNEKLPDLKEIFGKLADMYQIKDTLSLYKDFYRTLNIPDKLVLHEKEMLEWADVYPFLYFHAAFAGLKENKMIKHLVIDEMQDYTPIQYAVINQLFRCKKTILGDFGQSLNPNHLHTLNDLNRIYQNAEVVKLNKSYRSTFEIIQFAKRIQNVEELVPVERHGDIPEVIICRDSSEELEKIREKIEDFQNSGRATLGIILKTNEKAETLSRVLGDFFEIQLLTPESRRFSNGITVTSVQMSKGLEFDEVIIPSADRETYHTDHDRKLLYIASTRAMHKLSFLHTGMLTGLIGEERPTRYRHAVCKNSKQRSGV